VNGNPLSYIDPRGQNLIGDLLGKITEKVLGDAASSPASEAGEKIGDELSKTPAGNLSCSDRCTEPCLPNVDKYGRVFGEDPFLECRKSCIEHCNKPPKSSPSSCVKGIGDV